MVQTTPNSFLASCLQSDTIHRLSCLGHHPCQAGSLVQPLSFILGMLQFTLRAQELNKEEVCLLGFWAKGGKINATDLSIPTVPHPSLQKQNSHPGSSRGHELALGPPFLLVWLVLTVDDVIGSRLGYKHPINKPVRSTDPPAPGQLFCWSSATYHTRTLCLYLPDIGLPRLFHQDRGMVDIFYTLPIIIFYLEVWLHLLCGGEYMTQWAYPVTAEDCRGSQTIWA